MTLGQIRNEIWQQIGEPSDLDPTTDTQYLGGPLLNWVASEGQRQIATWKDPVTRTVLRHPQLYGEMFFQTVIRTYVLDDQSGATTSTMILPAGAPAEDDRYNGWLVTAGSQTKLVVDYVGTSVTIQIPDTWSTQPLIGETVTLTKKFMMLGGSTEPWISDHIALPLASTVMRGEGNLIEVLKVEDIVQQVDLEMSTRVDASTGNIVSIGDPTMFARRGNRIIFDIAPATPKWYRMEYFRVPQDMAFSTDVPELADQFHYGIVLWGKWWDKQRSEDYAAAYSVSRDIDVFMRKTVSLQDIKLDRQADRGSLRRK